MPFRPESETVLVVGPDVMLGRVLSRVLARDGLRVVHAVSAAQAQQLVEQHRPRLVLLDCGVRGGNALELVEDFHTRYANLPLILLSASPPAPEALTGARGRVRVLGKPLELHELRQAVAGALRAEDRIVGENLLKPTSPPEPTPAVAPAKEFRMSALLSKTLKVASFVIIGLVVLAGFAALTGIVHLSWPAKAEAQTPPPQTKAATQGIELVAGRPYTLAVPEDVRQALGIRKGQVDLIAVAKKPTQTRPLVMPGSTALDPTRLFRIRARFAPSPSSAEVVEIGTTPEDVLKTGKTDPEPRELRSGDRVNKGDLLAVFHSVDVGNNKNDLIDAMYQLKLDEEILKRAEAKAEAVPEVFLLNARRNVQGDINTINRAVSTLKTWGIPEEDIQAVRDEAENVIKRQGKHDKAKDALWARVEIRAPDEGVIIERNVTLHEIVVDNTTNLFQIAKVDKLAVFAHVPEDDLPKLEALTGEQRRWTVKTVGSDPIPGFIDDVGYLIDPNQHTAVVKGHIDNKEGKLRAGQFISATVSLPPPADVVEVPVDAVVEDGQQCVVFVQADPKRHPDHFTMRRVELTHRFEKTAFVRSRDFAATEQPTAEEKELGMLPKEPLRPGERLLASGVGELKAALLDRESQPRQ
jgi:cobalt-zinc-cadmium efflux system membrane fusion protein